jgi:iron complex transport system substrate-binding protein
MPGLAARPGWAALQAVRRGQVYVADGNRYFNRSGPTVFESVGVLAEILHPEIVRRASERVPYRKWEPSP